MEIPLSEIEFNFSRSPGPGGQNVNRRETKVEAMFSPDKSLSLDEVTRARLIDKLGPKLDSEGRLRVVSSRHRTQSANRSDALEKLATVIGAALKPPPRKRKPSRPTKASIERRLTSKRVRSQIKKVRRSETHDERE